MSEIRADTIDARNMCTYILLCYDTYNVAYEDRPNEINNDFFFLKKHSFLDLVRPACKYRQTMLRTSSRSVFHIICCKIVRKGTYICIFVLLPVR